MHIRGFTLLVAMFAFLSACSSDSSSDGAAPPGTTSDFSSSISAVVCAGQKACCTKGFDEGACNTTATKAANAVLATALLDHHAYDASAGARCIEAAKKYYADPNGCSAGMFDFTSACPDLIAITDRGSKKVGETCTDTRDCALSGSTVTECGHIYPMSDDNAAYVCVEMGLPGKQGESCNLSHDGMVTRINGCEPGLYCGGSPKTCKPLAAIGAPCDDLQGCVSGAFCDSGVCKAGGGAGAACTGNFMCGQGFYCDSAAKTCASLKADGQPCTVDEECLGDACNLDTKVCVRGSLSCE